ncbi:hypothetical protein PYCCODRAFT_1224212 [Trametes coccinea BRFM310]|uniref:Uncharacterized protein n=1 Tax=Trametes coccinea (strain BRFM310) TaxID=1353009 RepID=A0A1Y2IVZ7_TRAC3|nr:hypothetical protein PYCCODRAFT_1224212 [Trametes coccinea BRFM310]
MQQLNLGFASYRSHLDVLYLAPSLSPGTWSSPRHYDPDVGSGGLLSVHCALPALGRTCLVLSDLPWRRARYVDSDFRGGLQYCPGAPRGQSLVSPKTQTALEPPACVPFPPPAHPSPHEKHANTLHAFESEAFCDGRNVVYGTGARPPNLIAAHPELLRLSSHTTELSSLDNRLVAPAGRGAAAGL